MVDEIMDPLTQHIREEEKDDLPKLEDKISSDDSVALAKSFRRTKMFVPTRSHGSMTNKPPFETVAGLLAAPMDKLADMFRKFPKDNRFLACIFALSIVAVTMLRG